MTSKRIFSVLGGAGLAGLLAAGIVGARSEDALTSSFTTRAVAAEAARVVRVIDADTYVLLSGATTYRLRLLGVDAPEHDQAFGPQATDSVRRLLVPGRVVRVAKAGRDLYGRTLGAVLLPTAAGAAADRAVALDSLLVARGWVWAYDPNRRVAGRAAQQVAAQRAGRGLWKCGVAAAVPPQVWRGFNYQNKRRYGAGCSW